MNKYGLELLAMEIANKKFIRFFERGLYSFSVTSEKENNPNNVLIKFSGNLFTGEGEYSVGGNKFSHAYSFKSDFCFAEIRCKVFYGSQFRLGTFEVSFPEAKYSDWDEHKFIRFINSVTGLSFNSVTEMEGLVKCLAFLSEDCKDSSSLSGEEEFLIESFNSFSGLNTGEELLDKKIDVISKHLSVLNLSEGKVEINNLSPEERRSLKSNISSYLEILDRRSLVREETKFLQYIKDLIVLDEKANS